MKKNCIVIVCLITLLAIALLAFFVSSTSNKKISFRISHGTDASTIIHAQELEDGGLYVFLPSYVQMENVTYAHNGFEKIVIDGQVLKDGMSCEAFEINKTYKLQADKNTTICFLKSNNVATIYIDTQSGNLEHIHNGKDEKEAASVRLLDQEGNLNCYDALSQINVRGNHTATAFEKKPYLLTLSKEHDLLGMGAATKWVLLANAEDPSHLRNRLVFELADRVGFSWTPESKYVDVFLNGNYNGLYLLVEKMETGTQRLNIDTNSGDFLCRVDYEYRWNELNAPFKTELGRTIEINSPEYITKTQKDRIMSLVNEMENSILHDAQLENIDVESFARRYLIDEISGNIDADIGSSFFYYTDGKFFAGPVWDYDMSFGISLMNENPESFLAKEYERYRSYKSEYYSVLYENELFYNTMTQVYQTEFIPALKELVDVEIPRLSEQIATASELNAIRWAMEERDQISLSREIQDYIIAKEGFLSSVWIDGEEYCMVNFNLYGVDAYWKKAVKKGSSLGMIPEYISNHYIDSPTGMEWLVEDTQEPFDPTQILYDDVFLIERADLEKPVETPVAAEPKDRIVTIMVAASFLGMGILLIGLIAVDAWRNKRSTRTDG